jgi:hypothetical protein
MGSVVYTATKRCDPETHPAWPKFIAQSRLTQLREVVSLDEVLCPNVFDELTAEDWKHNVQADFKTHLFHDLDHVLARVTGTVANVLALIEEPSATDVASFRDSRFVFCGFDLLDKHGGISSLINCGGFDRAFQPGELSGCGLLEDHARAIAVQRLMRSEYPDKPHARCRVWAIWRLKG